MNTPESDQMVDGASKFSLDYFNLLEELLHFEPDESGKRVIPPGATNILSFENLRNQLLPLLIDNTSRTAIRASKDYWRDQNQSQTVGFRLIDDESFEKFIKMGSLCGNRVVLWDFIGTRVLANLDGNPSVPDTVKTLATNLMPLKPIVEAGGLVMLPHPTDWSKEIRQKVSQKLQEIKQTVRWGYQNNTGNVWAGISSSRHE